MGENSFFSISEKKREPLLPEIYFTVDLSNDYQPCRYRFAIIAELYQINTRCEF